jgi:hypothetical protein
MAQEPRTRDHGARYIDLRSAARRKDTSATGGWLKRPSKPQGHARRHTGRAAAFAVYEEAALRHGHSHPQ